MHWYSNSLFAIAQYSSLFMSKLFTASFSRENNFNLPHSLEGFSGRKIVEITEAMIAGELGNFKSDLSLILFLPYAFSLNHLLFGNS